MRYFFDTEFIEDGKTIELLSIGIVAEDGRAFYAENQFADFGKANDWVRVNVLPHLWSRQYDKSEYNAWIRDGGSGGLLTCAQIARDLRLFIGDDKSPEFWADYGAYDWVALCQLFGTMMDLPQGFPMFVRDVQQELSRLFSVDGEPMGGERIDAWNHGGDSSQEHNALADARETKRRWELLRKWNG